MMVIRKVLYKEGRNDRRGGTVIDRQTDQGLINDKGQKRRHSDRQTVNKC